MKKNVRFYLLSSHFSKIKKKSNVQKEGKQKGKQDQKDGNQ